MFHLYLYTVLQCCGSETGTQRSGAFLTPGSGMGEKSGSGSGIRDEQRSNFRNLRNNLFFWLKYLKSLIRIRDPGWKKFGSGMEKVESGIWDKNPGSATLQFWS